MKKRALSLLLAVLMLVTVLPVMASAANMTFNDVPTDAWFYADVKNAFEKDLINGKNATTFAPYDNLTYAEAVKLAAAMNQKFTTGSVTLQNGNPWYQSYVDYAKTAGIIDKDYNWNQAATRAGYMEIFAKALPDTALPAINSVPDGSIPDVPMSHPQAAAIYKLYRAGILQGSSDYVGGVLTEHLCKPSDNIRRCEVAAILTRMLDDSARKDVVTGAPAPDVDRSAEFAVLAGTWSENDWSKGSISTLEIDSKGNWFYSEYISVGATDETIEYSGTLHPAAGEPNAYYAIDTASDQSFYFRFTPANENDIGSDAILWNDGDDNIVLLREE